MFPFNPSTRETEAGGLELKVVLDCIVTSFLHEPKSNKPSKGNPKTVILWYLVSDLISYPAAIEGNF